MSTDPVIISESFKYKTSITGKTANDGNTLKALTGFWRTLC